jgi:hypothetical protein
MKTVTIVNKELSIKLYKEPNDFNHLYDFILLEIKKLTGLQTERIPFVISPADTQQAGSIILNVRWAAYDEPHTAALQTMYRESDPRLLNLVEGCLGFVDAAEMLVVHFIELFFSISSLY